MTPYKFVASCLVLPVAGCLAAEPAPVDLAPVVLASPTSGEGAGPTLGDHLSLPDALAIARTRAPRLLAARARERSAEGA
ncbi:MAG: hypothetical protein L0216_09900, partial [Planctomycetales bacterium]|nr:hypothetical protein [Planctomycetales bacterium]